MLCVAKMQNSVAAVKTSIIQSFSNISCICECFNFRLDLCVLIIIGVAFLAQIIKQIVRP